MIITQTPLRISFAGGGTDLPGFYREEGGCVLSMAIDKYVYVVLKERFDDRIYVNYSRKEIVERVDDLRHELVREAMRLTGVERGVEVTSLADIPSAGSGLGSSSSVTVGLLNAFYAYRGVQVPAEQLARESCQIEIDILGKPIGKQDQYIAAYGDLQFITFHPDESVTVEPVRVNAAVKSELSAHLLLFFSGLTRQAAPILKEQSRKIPQRRGTLREMKQQAQELREVLENGAELSKVGELLHAGWQRKKTLASNISNSHLDELYERAREAGAIGGKVTGAGGGGFLALFVPPESQSSDRQALSALQEFPFNLSRDGSKVIFNVRR